MSLPLRVLGRAACLSLALWLPLPLTAPMPEVRADGNPCLGRAWVSATVLALRNDDHSGIGGTGRSGDDYGIGGTGRSRRDPGEDVGIGGTGHGDDHGVGGTGHGGDGLGGTGQQARGEDGLGGTGIVGVVAGFGSICVGGQELHYAQSTPVSMDGRAVNTEALALGQAVSVRVTGTAEHWQASEISVLHIVAGPVSSVTADSFQILGQTVLRPAALTDAALASGPWLAISGSRLPDGRILATRITEMPADSPVSVMGPLQGQAGQLKIGDLPLTLPAGSTQPAMGTEVWLQGRWQGDQFHAERLQTQPRLQFHGPISRVLLEGYVRQRDGQGLNVEGSQVDLPAGLSAEGGTPGSRVQIQARLDSVGHLRAERLMLERPAMDSRGRPDTGDASRAGRAAGDTRPDDATRASSGDSLRPDAIRGDSSRSDMARPDWTRPDVIRPDIARPDSLRPERFRPDFIRPDMPRRP